TQILRDIAVESGKFTEEDRGDIMPLRMLVGMGSEAILAQLYPDMDWQPEVMAHEGIEGHCDGLSVLELAHPDLPQPFYSDDEFKYTAKSLREKGKKADQYKDIRTEWMWMRQGMGYCKLWSVKLGVPVRHCRYHIMWAMGAYEKFTLDE